MHTSVYQKCADKPICFSAVKKVTASPHAVVYALSLPISPLATSVEFLSAILRLT